MPDPFLVLATQNPIETEGTYALPEAQVDRFMLKVLVGYPTPTEEFAIVERMTNALERVHAGALDRRAGRRSSGRPTRCTSTRRCTTTRSGSRSPPAPRPARDAGAGALHHVRGQPARLDQPDPHRPGARLRPRPRVRPARGRARHGAPTSCATGSCCRTRRCRRTSPPTGSWPRSSQRVPPPTVPAARAMPSSPPAPERVLQRLDWHVVRRLDGLLQGEYRSLFRGPGMDLAGLREYQPGDDVRVHRLERHRAHRPSPTSASTTRTARSRPGSCWTSARRSTSGRRRRPAQADGAGRLRDDARAGAHPARATGSGRSSYGGEGRADDPGRVRADRGPAPDRRAARASRCCTPRAGDGPGRACSRRASGRSGAARWSSSCPTSSATPGWERRLHLLNQRHELLAVRLVDPRERDAAGRRHRPRPGRRDRRAAGGRHGRPAVPRAVRGRGAAREAELEAALRRAGVEAVTLSTEDDLVRAIVRMARRAQAPAGGTRMTFLWPVAAAAARARPAGHRRSRRRIDARAAGPRSTALSRDARASTDAAAGATAAPRPARRRPRGRARSSCSSWRSRGRRRRRRCRGSRAR